MSIFEIPLTATPQAFTIALAGVNYQGRLLWNNIAGIWVLDLADNNGNAILSGVPLVTGEDLLTQFGYLGIGGQLTCATDDNPNAPPTFFNLGSTGHLYFTPN